MTTANLISQQSRVDFTPEANRAGNEKGEVGKGVNVAAVVVPVVLCILIAALLLAGFFYWKRRKFEKELNIKPVIYQRATKELPTGVENVCGDDREVLVWQEA
ncbi:hypothetical protein OS493_029802 [Desmophyllum pertusum]|uniref:Uncharacterized protein n=1 Tax=Desmophyllum pertusum TaxID=174260 RepID=A0A9X0CPN7_9CNID|nr:hypothetical protein OS493_029802 [Desmophyllum pertusum]